MDKYPSDLSGGQKQRAVIARAIILNPVLLVADEPVSMLDMSVRAKILELMLALKRDFDLTYLYITHDLATAKFFCDRIAIMYLGRIVEIGPSEAIYEDPKHPYTQALLRAIPEPDPRRSVPRDLPRGEVPGRRAAAARLLVPSPLPARVRDLRLGGARPQGSARGPLGAAGGGGVRGRAADVRRPGCACGRGDRASGCPPGAVRAARICSPFSSGSARSDPDEPFWTGVRHLHAGADALEIEWHDSRQPKLVPPGGSRSSATSTADRPLTRALRRRRFAPAPRMLPSR